MGCQPAKIQQGIYDQFNFNISKGQIDSFDKEIPAMETALTEAEIARYNFSSKYGRMIHESGSIVLRRPNLTASIMGLLYQTARDCSAEALTYFQINPNDRPYVKLIEGKVPSKGVLQTRDYIINYIEECEKLQPNINKISSNIVNLNTLFHNNHMKWKTEHTQKFKNDAKAQGAFTENLNKLRLVLQRALLVLQEISDKCTNMRKEINSVFDKFKNDEAKKKENLKFKAIFDKNSKAKTEDNRILYKQNTSDLVLENDFEWSDLYSKKIMNNKPFVQLPQTTEVKPVDEKKAEQENEAEAKKEEIKDEQAKVADDKEEQEYKKQMEEVIQKNRRAEQEAILSKKKADKKKMVYVHLVMGLTNWLHTQKYSDMIPEEGTYAKVLSINFEENMLMIGTKSGKIHTFNLIQNEFVSSFEAHTESVKSLIYFNDKKTFISGGKDGKLIKWNMKNGGGKNQEFSRKTPGPVRSIITLLDGESIYVGSQNNLQLYNIFSKEEEFNLPLSDQIIKLIWIKEERLIVAGLMNGAIVLVNHDKKEIVCTFNDHKQKVTGLTVCLYNGKNAFASSSKDNTINLYDPKEKTLITTIQCFNNIELYPKELIYGYDGKTFYTAHADGRFCLIDYTKPNKKNFNNTRDSPITAAIFDNNTIIVSNKDGSVNFFGPKN